MRRSFHKDALVVFALILVMVGCVEGIAYINGMLTASLQKQVLENSFGVAFSKCLESMQITNEQQGLSDAALQKYKVMQRYAIASFAIQLAVIYLFSCLLVSKFQKLASKST